MPREAVEQRGPAWGRDDARPSGRGAMGEPGGRPLAAAGSDSSLNPPESRRFVVHGAWFVVRSACVVLGSCVTPPDHTVASLPVA